MAYVIITILTILVVALLARLLFLKRAIRETKQQLSEVNRQVGENRILTMSAPDKEFEKLLQEINHTLQAVREERVTYDLREQAFKEQIENISHDLRTPLTSMMGYLKLMQFEGLEEEEKKDIQVVLRKAERLRELITQFYEYSRVTAQEYSLPPEETDVGECLRDALADAYSELEKKELQVVVELPEHEMVIVANKAGLQRVFQNILQNAGRYAKEFLEVVVWEEETVVNIVFSNDAADLKEEEVKRFFERFYTTDAARNSGATGLGLAIVKQLVETMGGNIEAELHGKRLELRLRYNKN